MSGSPAVYIPGELGDQLVPALQRIVDAAALDNTPFALIGGLAVVSRAQSERATSDVDTVIDSQDVDTIVRIMERQGDVSIETTPSDTVRIYVDERKVEMLSVMRVSDIDGLTERQALFVTAHSWALEHATPLDITCTSIGAPVTVPVAVPGALLAMKLHAIQDRAKAGGDDKRISDASDIVQLLIRCDRAILDDIAAAPLLAVETLHAAATGVLVDQATTTARHARSSTSTLAQGISADELVRLAEPVLAATTARLR